MEPQGQHEQRPGGVAPGHAVGSQDWQFCHLWSGRRVQAGGAAGGSRWLRTYEVGGSGTVKDLCQEAGQNPGLGGSVA